ncbi:MAG TPA: hypothetical protein PKW98_07245 [Candidatus Wallbacteria bacterium]|nr:hypothetical protein [Candidatus Wallbacteria bacterium]
MARSRFNSIRFSALFLLIVLTAAFSFAGCSGGGSGGATPAKVIYSDTKAVDASGGSFSSPTHKVGVDITPSTFYQQSQVGLEVLDAQHSDVQKDGFYYSPNGVNLSLDPSALEGIGRAANSSAVREIRVRLPYAGSYSQDHPPLFIAMNQNGFFVPVDFVTDTVSSTLVGLVDTMEISALMEGVAGKLELKIFTANIRLAALESGAISASVKPFNRTRNKFETGAIPSLAGKRVALVVHGITSSLKKSREMGEFLATFRKGGVLYYDHVIGFDYSSNARISELGAKMAAMTYPYVASAAQLDVFAHSMGNLVARYAMTTQNAEKVPNRLSMVKHYVALGGPHEGVPLVTLSGFKFFDMMAYILGIETVNCVYDLLTYVDQLEPYTAFLRDLNDFSKNAGVGPEYKTLRVYSMAGQTYSNYYMSGIVPAGRIFNYMYKNSVENSGKPLVYKIDGIVADYSAGSTTQKNLGKLSEYHKNTPGAAVIFPELNHGELFNSLKAFNQVSDWLNNYWD